MSSGYHPPVLSDLAERILADCRGAVGEVRFGFGSKRQVWAFEQRHKLDVAELIDQLAEASSAELLAFALVFHHEFRAVTNAWLARDRLQQAAAGLCARGDPEFMQLAGDALIDADLALRHWLLAAYAAGPAEVVFDRLQQALVRAYPSADQWALLARLRAIAEPRGWTFNPETSRLLASLAQISARPEDRVQALELLAVCGGSAAAGGLARAVKGDTDPAVRTHAAKLLDRL